MDIRWTRCEHTEVGTLPCGMAITLEKSNDGVYVDIGGEPMLDIYPNMDDARDAAEMAAMPFIRHLSPADTINARLEGYAL